MEFINALPPDARVLFLGEARPFYCDRAAEVATVFDKQPIAAIFAGNPSPEEILARLRERGITHLLVNTSELARLQDTYTFRYKGKPELGMLNDFNWPLFQDFAVRHLKIVYMKGWPEERPFDWSKWNEYRAMAVKQARSNHGYPGFVAVYEIN
jgi:hypothetical protein